jgi:uncharacterized protein
MEFDWDPSKAIANEAKHSVSFAEAALVFGDPKAPDFVDDSGWPDEERWRRFA